LQSQGVVAADLSWVCCLNNKNNAVIHRHGKRHVNERLRAAAGAKPGISQVVGADVGGIVAIEIRVYLIVGTRRCADLQTDSRAGIRSADVRKGVSVKGSRAGSREQVAGLGSRTHAAYAIAIEPAGLVTRRETMIRTAAAESAVDHFDWAGEDQAIDLCR
jgi:hypothetical protein